MPPQAEFYTVVAGTDILQGSAASQLIQTEYARVYNLRFDDIANHAGTIEVYWNGELTYAGPADATPGEDAVSVYVIGSGYQDTLEIRSADGGILPDPEGLEMVALDYADWSMIESRNDDGQAAPGAPEIPPEVAEAAAASNPTNPPVDPPLDPPVDPPIPSGDVPTVDPTGEYLTQTVETQSEAMYSIRFEAPGGFDVYWNDELVTTVPASDEDTFTQLYVEGTGSLDTLEIEPHEGAAVPDLSDFDLSIVVDDESADLAALLVAAVPVIEDATPQTQGEPEDDLLFI